MATAKSVAFYVSQDVGISLRVKILDLEGQVRLMKASDRLKNPQSTFLLSKLERESEMLVSVKAVNVERKQALTVPVFASHKPFTQHKRNWNEWIVLPININQLDLNVAILIELWEYDGVQRVPFARILSPIFADDHQLKRGYETLIFSTSDENGENQDFPDESRQCPALFNGIIKNDMNQLNLNRYLKGEIKKIPWLDDISLKKLKQPKNLPLNSFALNIQYPVFDLPIVYTEYIDQETQKIIPTIFNIESNDSLLSVYDGKSNSSYNGKRLFADAAKAETVSVGINKISLGGEFDSTLKFYDPDQYNPDLVEEKYLRMERASKNIEVDKHGKPDAKKRDYLKAIINYPPGTKLTQHEKGSVWKYRYYLKNNKKALTKLLQSTNLSEEPERQEVLELMDSWAEIEIDDAIELLGYNFKNLSVRSYAVNRLKKASNKELELYLLELVEAVSFENLNTLSDKSNSVFTMLNESKSYHGTQHCKARIQQDSGIDENITHHIMISPLANFLIERALRDKKLGICFYWYLMSELQDKPYLETILEAFLSKLQNSYKKVLDDQTKLFEFLSMFCLEIKKSKDSLSKKTDLLHHLLNTKLRSFLKNKTIALPLDPEICVTGIITEQCKVFKSSMSPIKLTFKTNVEDSYYSLMYKVGDDLRQDQLVVQIISLMNELLLNENLDLKLISYKILSTKNNEGAIQFIPNETMASILSTYHGILPYFKAHYPDDSQSLGVAAWVMDNFVKSCAGYCVITYILGVGDRHLDNLLIRSDGHFFHADFGYILGQDPTPFPPVMKLSPQMIEAFGGADSANYDKFRRYCFVAYSILRRNAGLILNLFELMKHSNIPDIRIDPEGAIQKVKERFNLNLSEDEATIHFQNLINSSVNALLPIVIDHLHNFAQNWRN